MGSVDVKVVMEPGWEKKLKKMPQVKSALTDEAGRICATANTLAAGFRTEKTIDYKTKKKVGGTKALYGMKKARAYSDTAVAIVHPANYAAMKDNYLHNTLLKAMK